MASIGKEKRIKNVSQGEFEPEMCHFVSSI